jgi:hypothetical protein
LERSIQKRTIKAFICIKNLRKLFIPTSFFFNS